MKLRKLHLLLATVILTVGVLLGMKIESVVSGDNTYQNLQKIDEAYQYIVKRYVDTVDSDDLSEKAIKGMLEQLDPHSIYIDASQMKDVKERFEAEFEGIGIYYNVIDDTIRVLSAIPGGPSDDVGIRSGDRIVRVGDTSAVGWDNEAVQSHLKGPKGTEVTVHVRRPGRSELISFDITRDKIPIKTVDTAYMIEDEIGYIRLNRFARTTFKEFKDAMTTLEGRGMERLVLDLRGNAGGFMQMAIKIADEFLSNGETVVYTKSRHQQFNKSYAADGEGSFQGQPLIVLVDEASASASEIVAGAMQDHDRALIVGRRTFGKGLVQQQFPLPDGSVLQMTVSRYYTPAGRLIQTPYDRDEEREDYYAEKKNRLTTTASMDVEEFIENAPDSLMYQTDHGRTVYGGGGIIPDVIVPRDTVSEIQQDLARRQVFLGFARTWIDRNGDAMKQEWGEDSDRFVDEFEVSEEMHESFWKYAHDHGVRIGQGGESAPDSTDDGVEIVYYTEEEVAESQHEIDTRIKARLGRRLWGLSTFYQIRNTIDPELQEALELWDRAENLLAMYAKPRNNTNVR